MEREKFGVLQDGRTAYLYTIGNSHGIEAKISDFGGIVTKLLVPNKNGVPTDIVLGFDTLAEYEKNPPYLGALIGRCGNRILGGRFTLDGVGYQLDCNEGANHLHGGYQGFDKKLWSAEQKEKSSLKLTLFSADNDQGYPGNLVASVTYTVTEDDALCVSYRGMSDRRTIFNMTNHSYFNLAGQDADTILDHHLLIDADKITTIAENMGVTGEYLDVTGTPFDFRKAKTVGADIEDLHPQLTRVRGYDHNYMLNPGGAASVYCEKTGISMTVCTDRPGVQLYTGNYLDESLALKGGRPAQKYRALCLETQQPPDAINHPNLGDPTIEAGIPCEYATYFQFSAGRPAWMD